MGIVIGSSCIVGGVQLDLWGDGMHPPEGRDEDAVSFIEVDLDHHGLVHKWKSVEVNTHGLEEVDR